LLGYFPLHWLKRSIIFTIQDHALAAVDTTFDPSAYGPDGGVDGQNTLLSCGRMMVLADK
tara:strand:- start:1412 stop:1591 length:180 start_codon:yes stop_codon:yes gene_type:complete